MYMYVYIYIYIQIYIYIYIYIYVYDHIEAPVAGGRSSAWGRPAGQGRPGMLIIGTFRGPLLGAPSL